MKPFVLRCRLALLVCALMAQAWMGVSVLFAQIKQDAFVSRTAADSSSIYLESETRDRLLLPNNDTLLIRKGNGELWFGVWGGAQYGTYLGTLRLERNRFGLTPRPVDFTGGFLSGYAIGLMGEWLPKNEQYGVQLRLGLTDVRNGLFTTDSTVDAIRQLFTAETKIGYLTVSPSARYFLSSSRTGMYVFGGADIEIPTVKQRQFTRQLDSGGVNIIQLQRWIDLEQAPVRIGGHLGIGTDFLIGELSQSFRVRFSPFVSIHAGTAMAQELGTSFSGMFVRAGVSVKVGLNEVVKSVLPYDSTNVTKPLELSSIRRGGLIDFTFRSSSSSVARAKPIELSFIRQEESIAVNTERAVTEEVLNLIAKDTVSKDIAQADPCADVQLNMSKFFAFNGERSSELTPQMREYLDKVVECLQGKPDIGIVLTGRTDSIGSRAEMQQISEARWTTALGYITSKGITRERIVGLSMGASQPIGTLSSEEGRKQNRSVEVKTVPVSSLPSATLAQADPCADVQLNMSKFFAFNGERSSELTPQMREYLDKVVECLQGKPDIGIVLTGRTDSIGSRAEMQQISEARWTAALGYITSKGITRERIVGLSMGASQPIGTLSSEEGRKQNRSVEVKTVPVSSLPSATLAQADPCADIPANASKFFVFNGERSSALTPTMQEYLDKLIECMKENPEMGVIFTGRSDNIGTNAETQRISTARSTSAVVYLVSKGISRDRIAGIGLGANQPTASLTTLEGRRQNRSVEMRTTTIDSLGTIQVATADSVRKRLEAVVADASKIEKPKTKEEACKDVPFNVERRFLFNGERSVALTQQMLDYLDKVAECMKLNPDAAVSLTGRTDNFGTQIETRRVSESRADAAVKYLLSKGIARVRMTDVGIGALRPIADMSTERGRRENRSITIQLVRARR